MNERGRKLGDDFMMAAWERRLGAGLSPLLIEEMPKNSSLQSFTLAESCYSKGRLFRAHS